MKIAMAQTNPVIGDFKSNGEKILSFTDKALSLGCDLVVFPELAISGYPPWDLLEKDDFIQLQLHQLNEIVNRIQGIGVLCGFADINPTEQGPKLYNSAILFEDGKRLAKIDKQLLPTYDVFDESRYFAPGTESGPILYKGLNIGITICEDMWNDSFIAPPLIYKKNPIQQLAQKKAQLIINISASPFHSGRQKRRVEMIKTMAQKYGIPFLFANQTGGNDSIIFDGLSCVATENGRLAARATDFSEDLICFDTQSQTGDVHSSSGSDTESIVRALETGTRDYVKKCGFRTAVIGSSGGIDSAVTAAIAVQALGSRNVTTIFMPSPYTARQNFIDTKALADNLEIRWESHPITSMYQQFLKLSSSFDIQNPGIAEQNLQARIRGTILMAFSNKEGSILLSTGNKSEMAVGYATLYGDMCGGLAVIGDLPKKRVYEVARFINQDKEIIPESIITKAPSAELAFDQTDQDDLPPYDTIDAVVKGYIEEHKSFNDLVDMGLDRKAVKTIITRISRNEYKRYQAPPILRVTSKAFGPGRRYPMAHNFRQ